MLEKFFKLKERNTNVRTELLAGVTTFFAMAYIIFVNADVLGAAGMPVNAVMVATCLSAAIGTILIGLLANLPFAQAPGMGLNAFFAFTVVLKMGYTWEQALAAVFISGILFIIVTVTGLRAYMMRSIPQELKYAMGAGIGMFIALIGLRSAGIIAFDGGSNLPVLMPLNSPGALLSIIGLILTIVLLVRKVKGALLIGIVVTTLIGFIPWFGLSSIPENISMGQISLSETFLKLDFAGLFKGPAGATAMSAFLSMVTVVFSFFLIDMFDTMGTLYGTAAKAGMLDKEGNLPGGDRAMLSDAIATLIGSLLGTSTVTTFVESTSGISEGGRTGLASVATGILFLLCIFLAPVAGIVPAQATAPALILVGVMMIGVLNQLKFDTFDEALPIFGMLAMMPFAYSISDGIAFGFIFYVIVRVAQGKAKQVHPIMYGLVVLFILRFAMMASIG